MDRETARSAGFPAFQAVQPRAPPPPTPVTRKSALTNQPPVGGRVRRLCHPPPDHCTQSWSRQTAHRASCCCLDRRRERAKTACSCQGLKQALRSASASPHGAAVECVGAGDCGRGDGSHKPRRLAQSCAQSSSVQREPRRSLLLRPDANHGGHRARILREVGTAPNRSRYSKRVEAGVGGGFVCSVSAPWMRAGRPCPRNGRA